MNSSVLFIWYFYCRLFLKLYIFIEQLSLLTIEERRLNGGQLHCLSIAMRTLSQEGSVCISPIMVMM